MAKEIGTIELTFFENARPLTYTKIFLQEGYRFDGVGKFFILYNGQETHSWNTDAIFSSVINKWTDAVIEEFNAEGFNHNNE